MNYMRSSLMSEMISHAAIERGSEKSFGITFSIIFLLVALYPLVNSQDIYLWALIISAIFRVS